MDNINEIRTPAFFNNIEQMLNRIEFKKLADVFRVVSFKPFETYKEHKHPRLEMAYVKKGSCIIDSNGESVYFKQNELMIISSNANHSFQAGASGCTLLQLEFLLDVFEPIVAEYSEGDPSKLSVGNVFSTDNKIVKIVNNLRIMRAIQRIVTELNTRNEYYRHLIIMYYTELLILIYRHLSESYLPLCNNPFLTRAIGFIRVNYNKDISINEISKHVNIGDRYLRKLFSQHMNISPIDYLNQIRLNKAVELLRISEMSIKEICFECGFKSAQYFSRCFKQHLGISPKEIRVPKNTIL